MSARIRRFGAFGSGSSRGKAAGAVIACGVMLLTACGGSVSGGEATDAPSAIVRGDTLGRDWESTYPLVDASAGQVVVTWDKQIEEDPTESVVGYEVQISSGITGPWTGAGTGCARSETKSSTRQKCIATGLADGTYFFNVAAVRQPVVNKDKTGNFSRDTKTGNFSAGSPPAIVLSPPGIPATPTVVVGDSKVSVTVTAGTATDGTLGGVPASFTVTPTPATTPPMTCTAPGPSGSCDVTGLKDSTAYTFTATATNASSPVPSLPSAASSTAQWVTVSGTPTTAVVGETISLTTTGGSSTPTVSFTVTPTAYCKVTDTSLTSTRATGATCTVTANQGAHKSTATFPFTARVNHTVTFNSNGGYAEDRMRMDPQVEKSFTPLTASVFLSGGRNFAGWATTATGPVVYADKSVYPFTVDADLYAVYSCPGTARPIFISTVVRSGKDSARVDFSAPAPDQIAEEWDSFTASTTAGGQSATLGKSRMKTGGSDESIYVYGLQRHTGYSFTVTGMNAAGCDHTSRAVHVDKFD